MKHSCCGLEMRPCGGELGSNPLSFFTCDECGKTIEIKYDKLMRKTFKVGDKVLIKGGSDVFTITDISASRVHISNGMSWLLVIASDLTSIPEYPVDWQAGVSFVGPYKLPNSATISGKTYPIPDEKLDQVKKLVEPGLPKWDEIPSEIASNIPYYLKIAANFARI